MAQIWLRVFGCREQQISADCSAITCSLRRVHTTPNTMTNLSVSSVAVPTECLVCSELALLIHFFPCQHSIVCEGKSVLLSFPVLPHSLPVWTHKSRSVGMQSCLWPGTIPAWLQHCHCRWSAQAFCGRLGVVWAAADRQPRHELTDAVCNSEGRSDVSVVTGGAFSIKTSWERFLLLWLLWPICVSDVLMAACSNTTASLLPC